MSLSVVIKTNDALILATDSLLTIRQPSTDGTPRFCFIPHAQKLFALGAPHSHIAVSFVGSAAYGVRSAGDLVREFSREQSVRKTVEAVARDLHAFLSAKSAVTEVKAYSILISRICLSSTMKDTGRLRPCLGAFKSRGIPVVT